ncbi:MAG: RNB domain-containing ribonuclease [Polyangiaceae bacterium]
MDHRHGADSQSLFHIAEEAMLEQKFIPHPPPAALAEAESKAEPHAAVTGVEDKTALLWTSIDNPESRDLDQIEVVEDLGGGVTRLSVGIADVDYFVPANSAIDKFAATNTISVYTGVRTFPMLPEKLSFDLSSLVADQSRLCIIVESDLKSDGTLVKGRTYRALVKNRAKLDYPSISAWLDGTGPLPHNLEGQNDLQDQIRKQDALAKNLAAARKAHGALDVETEQQRAVMEGGEVTGMVAEKQTRAGGIIEELMIASNRTVALSLDAAGFDSIRRVVKQPERWAKIAAYANERGVKLPAEPSSIALSQFVDKMRSERAAEFAEISLSIVKLMGRGEYVAHAPGSTEIGHFGLATAEYTHSTAPNRRYVDLVTQRMIKALAVKAKSPYSFEALSQIATHSSEREAAADKVERRVRKSAAARLLGSKVGQHFDGIITGASDKGVFVRVFHPTAEGKVVHGGNGLKVGDRVKVTLRDTNVARGFIDFVVDAS